MEQRQINKALRKLYLDKSHPFNWKKWNELHIRVTELKKALGESNLPEELKKGV